MIEAPTMRRSPASTAGSTPPNQHTCLSPSQLEDLVALRLRSVCAGITDWQQPLMVIGTLGDLPAARYAGGRIYKLPLLDPAAASVITYLNIREAVLGQAYAEPGDLVRVTGLIVPEVFKGTVSFRLEVVALEHEAPTATPRSRDFTSSVDVLRRLAIERRPFPNTGQPTITLIHPAASQAQVAEDFAGALRSSSNAALHRVPVSMLDPAAIAAAIRDVRTDVVVLIRGGGDATDFAVFEDVRVLEALSTCRAYRILGLGHTANRTLAELVADYAASTPTAAGEHLGRRIAEAAQAIAVKGRIEELHETLAKRDIELAKRPSVRTIELEPEHTLVVTEPGPKRRLTVPGWLWGVVGAVAAFAVLKLA